MFSLVFLTSLLTPIHGDVHSFGHTSFVEAAHMRRELLDLVTDGYARVLRQQVRDYGITWSTAIKKLAQFHEYQAYADIFGKDSARRLFV